jgi:hypothetical protein
MPGQRVAPTRRTNAPPQLSGRQRNPLEDLARARQQEQQPEEEEPDAFGRGLGFLINNPVTKAVLKPFEVLDYGRSSL